MSSQTSGCNGNTGADLSHNYDSNPCDLTAINNTFDFDNYVGGQQKIYYGGQQVRDHLEEWWTKYFLPDLKSMGKQLTASLIEQTRQFGTMIDSQNITRTGGSLEKGELDLKRNNDPSEQACVSGSAVTAIAKAHSTSNALATGLTKDITKLSSNVVPTPTSDATAPSTATTTPPKISPAEDQKARWDEYCAEFFDPETNNGVNVCPEQKDPDANYQAIPDGDIMAEGFLFSDTIYMEDTHQSKAANALLRNLVYPKIREKLPDSAIKTATGREAILAQQHLDSARNIAANVVASILARRASVPSVSPETTPDPDAVPEKVVIPGGSGGQSYALNFAKNALSLQNSAPGAPFNRLVTKMTFCQKLTRLASGGNYVPAESAIKAWQKFGQMGVQKTGSPSPGDLVYFTSGSVHGHTGIASASNKYISVLRIAKPPVEEADMGPGSYWGQRYLGYVTPLDSGQEIPLLPPQSPGANVSEIRVKAGIPVDEVSENPSYNEIMLAMTKERFLNPEYFIQMQGNTGSIKQEQTSVNAYITMQYQDIYRLQEQINALLAARASLKFDAEKKSSQTSSAPVVNPSH
ncbi:MAG: C40 family peptidase [Alphaproteobacteria bacterium]|nr:C40 family peptidase [Alphaproteobacteria bacterium]